MTGFWSPSRPKPGILVLVAVLVLTLFHRHLVAEPHGSLTTAQSIRTLAPAEAAHRLPVRLRGVVTVPSTYKSSFFFMDATGGISIDRAGDETPVHAGDRVEIEGTTSAGQFAPVVNATAVRITGRENLPRPRLYELNELAGGEQDSQWVGLRGVVRSAAVQTVWDRQVLVLELDMGAGTLIPVHVRDFPASGWERLQSSIVQLRGVCGTVFNDRRQFVGLRVFTSSLADIAIETAAPADPFDTPLESLDQLLLFHAHGGSIQRIRVRGTVTYASGGQQFFIQNGHRGIVVRTRQNGEPKVGSGVEVVGYLATGRYSPELDDAIYREARDTQTVAATGSVAGGMVAMSSDGFVASPYDSMLVRLTGQVVQEIVGTSEDRLILEQDNTYFSAMLTRTDKRPRIYAPGTVLQLTGVCVTRFDSTQDARGFRILLRTPADTVVLRTAPWWTVEHAGWAVAVVLLLVLAGLGVSVLMRRDAKLHVAAMTDPLTGLYNRRAFVQLISHDWERAQRRGSTLLLFYMDLDRFKQINDTFGHKAGDEALCDMAEILRGCFRTTDVIARMGGDEFAVACDASAESPAAIEERLAEAVSRHNRGDPGGVEISLSVGSLVCDSSMAGQDIDAMIARADELMYAQKHASRDGENATGSPAA